SAEAHRASGRFWREAIDRMRLADLEGGRDEAQIERAKRAAIDAGIDPAIAEAIAGARGMSGRDHDEDAPRWSVGPDARWICEPAGKRKDLARHGSMRRVLDVLVERRLREPGGAIPAGALLDAGWPGERARYESALLRV